MITFGTAPSSAPTYTFANLPAAGVASRVAFVSNAGTKGSFWYDDGTRWKPMNGSAVLATVDTASNNIANSETIVAQYKIPAGLWQTNDRLRIFLSYYKSGLTDSGTLRFRLGTVGTTADTLVLGGTLLGATQKCVGAIHDFRLASATSVQPLLNFSTYGYGTPGNGALAAAATVSSVAANDVYFSVGILSGGTTDTVQIADGQFQLVSSAN